MAPVTTTATKSTNVGKNFSSSAASSFQLFSYFAASSFTSSSFSVRGNYSDESVNELDPFFKSSGAFSQRKRMHLLLDQPFLLSNHRCFLRPATGLKAMATRLFTSLPPSLLIGLPELLIRKGTAQGWSFRLPSTRSPSAAFFQCRGGSLAPHDYQINLHDQTTSSSPSDVTATDQNISTSSLVVNIPIMIYGQRSCKYLFT